MQIHLKISDTIDMLLDETLSVYIYDVVQLVWQMAARHYAQEYA